MKYNSIGEQLIAKAQELDPNYKPDKFNDMSEAINIILKNSGGGDKSVPSTLNLIDLDSETEDVRTSITQEEKDNLEKGLYNQVLYPDGTPFGYFMPSKMLGDKSLDINMFAQFCLDMNTESITSFDLYKFSIGGKNTSGNYPITIEKQFGIPIGSSGGSGGNIWYNLNTTSGTITQNQYDEIKSLIDGNSLAGIRDTTLGIYFPLVNSENNGTFTFGHYGLGSESTGSNTKYSMTKMEMIIKSDLSVSFNIKDVYVPVLTQNLSSQSIPSIKTDGYQENLTIGNGLEIKYGALQTTGPLLDLFPYWNSADQTITQEGFDLLTQKLFSNEIVGISLGEAGPCMLLSDTTGTSISFIGPYQGNSGRLKVTFNIDLSTKTEYVNSEGSSISLTLPRTAPSSQVIPSITTSNKQQNLTVGDGLKIENGVLKTNNIPELPSDASTKTYVLKSVNGVLTWSE